MSVYIQPGRGGRVMKQIDLTGKCGSCWYFHQIEGTAYGECRKLPYGDNVYHDSKHPYFEPGRSRKKCKLYMAKSSTNADFIRAMTDEELAELLSQRGCTVIEEWHIGMCSKPCSECWLDWLKQEVKDEPGRETD